MREFCYLSLGELSETPRDEWIRDSIASIVEPNGGREKAQKLSTRCETRFESGRQAGLQTQMDRLSMTGHVKGRPENSPVRGAFAFRRKPLITRVCAQLSQLSIRFSPHCRGKTHALSGSEVTTVPQAAAPFDESFGKSKYVEGFAKQIVDARHGMFWLERPRHGSLVQRVRGRGVFRGGLGPPLGRPALARFARRRPRGLAHGLAGHPHGPEWGRVA